MDGHGKVGLVEDARMKFHQLSPKLNMLGGEGGGESSDGCLCSTGKSLACILQRRLKGLYVMRSLLQLS